MTASELSIGGKRERRKGETHKRIAEVGLKLFLQNGYEGTTLDQIAAAAGISRRTFFHYYKSKDEILIALQGAGFLEALGPTLLEQSPELSPFDVVRKTLLQLVARHETKESILVDELLRSTEALRVRKQAVFIQMEQIVFDVLRQMWPKMTETISLRAVAMVSIGAMRVAMDEWRSARGKRPLALYLSKTFAAVDKEI